MVLKVHNKMNAVLSRILCIECLPYHRFSFSNVSVSFRSYMIRRSYFGSYFPAASLHVYVGGHKAHGILDFQPDFQRKSPFCGFT